jgi:DNA-binding transcriptional LysR family regulator
LQRCHICHENSDLRNYRIAAAIAPSHLLAKKNTSAMSLSTIPLIVRAGRPNRTRTENELNGLNKEGQKLAIVMRCGSSGAVKEAVRAGAGVGILYHDAVKRDIDQGEFEPVKIAGLNLLRQSYIVYLKNKRPSAVAREFLSLLRSSALQYSPVKTTPSRSSNGHGSGQARDYILRCKLL